MIKSEIQYFVREVQEPARPEEEKDYSPLGVRPNG